MWDRLRLDGTDETQLFELLKLIVLYGDAPSDFIARLAPLHRTITRRGPSLRAHWPLHRYFVFHLADLLMQIIKSFSLCL
jgi:hypothetical protein